MSHLHPTPIQSTFINHHNHNDHSTHIPVYRNNTITNNGKLNTNGIIHNIRHSPSPSQYLFKPIASQRRSDFAASNGYIVNEGTNIDMDMSNLIMRDLINPSMLDDMSAEVEFEGIDLHEATKSDAMVAVGEQNVNIPLRVDLHAYKHDPSQRVFVGRSLRLEKIKFFGFDMDYTLASYKSPQYEDMLFQRTISRLIDIGYPNELRKFQYNSNFPVRGLWFDMQFGNLLKVDGFGNILVGVHGFRFMKPMEIEEQYPNKFLHLNDQRIIVLNTLFNMPDMYLLATLVDFYDSLQDFQKMSDRSGVKKGDVVMSYKSIAQDVTNAVHWVHTEGSMKKHVLNNLDKYINKDERIKTLLTQLRQQGKTFLLTNSEYSYTHGVMNYLLGPKWTDYFDISVVDAKKPLWFSEGTVFRQVDTSTGTLKLGSHAGELVKGQVYAGGSCDAFRRLMKARGKEVLYIGDHIFGDVLRSKKSRGWRTFLVVPELEHELGIWTDRHSLFERLGSLESTLAKLYKSMDKSQPASTVSAQDQIRTAVKDIRNLTHEMDQAYGTLGPLFRSGSRTTFFATQVERYADLYAATPLNLIYYPTFYFFRAPMILMPHESTVSHQSKMSPRVVTKSGRQPSKTVASFCHEDIDDEPVSEEDANYRDTISQKSTISEANDEKFSLKADTRKK